MAYDLHYDRLLRAIQNGEEKEAISLFASKLFDVNEQIEYIFEDRKRYIVTPLYWAVRHRRPNVCKYLLRNGARAYEHMVYEYYPLHEACNMGYEDIVHEFVEARCNLDKVTSDCDTPLHVACMRGHISCVHILLRAGADCNLQNKAGHTPLEAALYHNHRDLVSLFEAHEKATTRDCMERTQPQTLRYERTQPPNPPSSTRQQQQCLQTPPTLVTQLSQASSCTAESPSPVEKDGVKSSISRHTHPAFRQTPFLRKTLPQPAVVSTVLSPVMHSGNTMGATVRSHSPTRYPVSKGSCPFPSGSAANNHGYLRTPGQQHHLVAPFSSPVPSRVQSLAHPVNRPPLSESASNPELRAPQLEVPATDRAKSCDDLFARRKPSTFPALEDHILPPARERINTISQMVWNSLHSTSVSQHHVKILYMDSVHRLLREMLPLFKFPPAQYQSLVEIGTPLCTTTKPSTATPTFPIARPSLPLAESAQVQEIEYDVLGDPLELKLGVPTAGDMNLLFRIHTSDHRILSGAEEVLLKVVSKVFNLANEQVWAEYHSLFSATAATFASSHNDPCLQEAAILKRLPPHPNIIELIYHFKGSTERFARHAKQHNPDDPLTMYMMAPTGDFLVLKPPCATNLATAVRNLKQKGEQCCGGIPEEEEEEIVMITAQILLALAHLNRHHIAHCAVLPENVLIDEEKGSVILSNLSHALNLNPCNLEAIKAAVAKTNNDFCTYSPEVLESLLDLDTQTCTQENLDNIFNKSDSYSAGRMMYSLILNKPSLRFSSDDHVPNIDALTPKTNQILRKLVAHNPKERFSALQGAVSCLVLLYGPKESEITSLNDCHRWLFSETLELHLRPVLKDYERLDLKDARAKLQYVYLTVADPEYIWDACNLFQQRV